MDGEQRDSGSAQSGSRKRGSFAKDAALAVLCVLGVLLLIVLIGRVVPPKGSHSWADIILAVVTAAYVVVTYFQLRALRDSIRVADEALDHARDTARKSRRIERQAQRAYLLPEPWLFPGKEPKWASMAPWVYRLSFKNIGQLPAFDAEVTARVERDGGPSLHVETATGRAYFIRDQSHNYVVTVPEASLSTSDDPLRIRVEITYTDPMKTKGRTAFTMKLEPVDYGTFYLLREGSVVK